MCTGLTEPALHLEEIVLCQPRQANTGGVRGWWEEQRLIGGVSGKGEGGLEVDQDWDPIGLLRAFLGVRGRKSPYSELCPSLHQTHTGQSKGQSACLYQHRLGLCPKWVIPPEMCAYDCCLRFHVVVCFFYFPASYFRKPILFNDNKLPWAMVVPVHGGRLGGTVE